MRLAVTLHTEDVPASRCPPWISTCCYKVSYVAVGVLVWSIADAASPRFQPLRNAIQWKPVMARRASVEHSCGWRRIWISHRKRSVAKRPNRRPRIALSIGAGSMKGRMQSNDSRAVASSSHAIDENSQILPQTPTERKKGSNSAYSNQNDTVRHLASCTKLRCYCTRVQYRPNQG